MTPPVSDSPEPLTEQLETLRADFNDCNAERARWKARAASAERERDELRAALKPFAECAKDDPRFDDCEYCPEEFTWGDLRRAADLLKGHKALT